MNFPIINNFLHLLATVVWIGGMIFINFILIPSQASLEPSQRGKFFGTVAKRYTIFVWGSVIVLLFTGLYKTPSPMLLNPTGDFGLWLTIKHIAILLMIVFGILITFVVSPKMKKFSPKPGEQPGQEFLKSQSNLGKLSLTNMILGVIVLFCVSMMQY